MINDPVADFITVLRNASSVGKSTVTMPYSNFKLAIAERLAAAGFVKRVSRRGQLRKKYLEVELAYQNGRPKIRGVKRLSKPSRRLYQPVRAIRFSRSGAGEIFLSTSRGILSAGEARRLGAGGEVLFVIW